MENWPCELEINIIKSLIFEVRAVPAKLIEVWLAERDCWRTAVLPFVSTANATILLAGSPVVSSTTKLICCWETMAFLKAGCLWGTALSFDDDITPDDDKVDIPMVSPTGVDVTTYMYTGFYHHL